MSGATSEIAKWWYPALVTFLITLVGIVSITLYLAGDRIFAYVFRSSIARKQQQLEQWRRELEESEERD